MKSADYRISPDSITGRLAANITDNWILGLRKTNPAILDMFRERDVLPYRDLLPWSGEFAGKYITGAYYIYRLTHDERIKNEIVSFIDDLVETQDNDGYLGCYSRECHLTGAFSTDPEIKNGTWDSWSHYHIMFGILLWNDEIKSEAWMNAVKKAAELFINVFYTQSSGSVRIVDIGSSEMNLSVLHVFAILYRMTGEKKYLDFAEKITEDLEDPAAGDYINSAAKGEEYYQCSKPRWESLHIIIGLTEMFRATGKKIYLDTAEHIFFSILKTDVHNTGAFSTNEQAVGNPFTKGSIETCCVIAYNALGVEIYKLTGDLAVIDHLEKSLYNACMGFWSPTGRWSTYDTPMEGCKFSNTTSIVFQSRPGSPELNCCSVNAPRGIGMLSEWAITEEGDSVFINAFESAEAVCANGAKIIISGSYPYKNEIHIEAEDLYGNVYIRIPSWSDKTSIEYNGSKSPAKCGSYYIAVCEGKLDIKLSLDFSTRYQTGRGDFEGKTCVYRGPLLFGTDTGSCRGYNAGSLPEINRTMIDDSAAEKNGDAIIIPLENGITLKDFAHLGLSGGYYTTWLNITDVG